METRLALFAALAAVILLFGCTGNSQPGTAAGGAPQQAAAQAASSQQSGEEAIQIEPALDEIPVDEGD
jgi:outer membrane biogenesis lipoprotein LolB